MCIPYTFLILHGRFSFGIQLVTFTRFIRFVLKLADELLSFYFHVERLNRSRHHSSVLSDQISLDVKGKLVQIYSKYAVHF